jgi:hypothetical protein
MKWGKATTVQRSRVSRWGDFRLWLGVSVLIGSMFIGARVMASGEETVTLWRATQDLAVGSSQLEVEPVVLAMNGTESSYLQGTNPPSGTMTRPVGAGELLPVGAMQAAGEAHLEGMGPIRIVTVPVNPLHVAIGINAGDQVDVWASPDKVTSSVSEPAPREVLSNITVIQIARDVVGTGGDIGVVLGVPHVEVSALVQAMRNGVIDLVKVPLEYTR